MSSSILHQCSLCGHVSDISLSLAAFIENPHCVQCGLSVQESNTKMQDELSSLFDRQMSMNQQTAYTPAQPHTQHQLQVSRMISPEPEPVPQPPITYSITQHYHHSAHVAQPAAPASSPAQAKTQRLRGLLLAHGIDPSTLSAAQCDLIQNADLAQQQRLLQTWQVYAEHGLAQSGSPDTAMEDSMDEDSVSAVEPYMAIGYGSPNMTHSADGMPTEPSTGEPYAKSTDPVYNRQLSQWWEVGSAPVESQYGFFEGTSRRAAMPNCAGIQMPQ
ncbi:Uncharacterized protein PECH_006786 [Penicillium ucsense]|uniref:Uncharacterized protein n=1 Tax=Penicillium ucsense TaxID=2839758 RepID=A0A8J8VWC2_9EURO|nr:Uncharacterized protein PECM_002255 [Penicillium ucsense]KAF7735370.1 Uncharacterized protein PECH_006786 [Penicillium ucsense]